MYIFMVTSRIKLVTWKLLIHKVPKSKMATNPALWFLSQHWYFCIINYFDTVSTTLTSQNSF